MSRRERSTGKTRRIIIKSRKGVEVERRRSMDDGSI